METPEPSSDGSQTASALYPDVGRLRLAIGKVVGYAGVGQSRHEGKRLVGVVEYVANALTTINNFSRTYNLVLIFNDDTGKDKEQYVNLDHTNRPWKESDYSTIRDDAGNIISTSPLDSIFTNIPSNWRKLPLIDKATRATDKTAWEEQIVRLLDDYKIDVLLSDSLMVILGRNIPEEKGILPVYGGRIVNVHPAITEGPHKLPGEQGSLDAVTRVHGYVTIKGKHIQVKPWNYTGATLHLIDRGIDTGPIIFSRESTRVFPDDTVDSLRHRNYPIKHEVVIDGLLKFASQSENRELILKGRATRKTI